MARHTGLSDLESQLDSEFEFLVDEMQGTDPDGEFESAFEAEFEQLADDELEQWDDPSTRGYGERFFEISQREWESEYEVDTEIDRVLTDMEQEYFFGRVAKRLAKGGAGKLLKKAKKYAASRVPALQAFKGATQLMRGNLKGSLRSLAKTALASHPAGAAAMPALRALGFEASQDMEMEQEAWENFANIARDAYESLAETMTENADQPLEASRLATAAFTSALAGQTNRSSANMAGGLGSQPGGRKIRVTASRGDTIIVRIT